LSFGGFSRETSAKLFFRHQVLAEIAPPARGKDVVDHVRATSL
jgi:hypothetical protein